MAKMLQINLSSLSDDMVTNEPIYKYEPPFAASEIYTTNIVEAKQLSQGEDVNVIYELTLNTKDIQKNYIPGDAIGILPRNSEYEVDEIFKQLSLCDQKYELCLKENVTKKNATIPKHLPKQGTLKNLFLYYLDLRAVPKKMFLKALVDFTVNKSEMDAIKKLCDPKNSSGYWDFVNSLQESRLLSLLKTFSSCQPPLEVLLEHLPALQPRYYSILSSPLKTCDLKVVFSVVQLKGAKGVCSGWLEKLVYEKVSEIPFYFRKSSNFLDINENTSVLLIAIGTGLAPFLGFLEERALKGITKKTKLYYGCRYSDRDYIYKDELEQYVSNNILQLHTAFSREPQKQHVQDKMKENFVNVAHAIVQENSYVCICGEVKNFCQTIDAALLYCLSKGTFEDEEFAADYLRRLKESSRYRVDMWL